MNNNHVTVSSIILMGREQLFLSRDKNIYKIIESEF